MYYQEMVFQPTTPERQQLLRDKSLASNAELELNYKVLMYGIKVSGLVRLGADVRDQGEWRSSPRC